MSDYCEICGRDYCAACENLKQENAEFVLNGVTQKICESLRKNTGLNPDLFPDIENSDYFELKELYNNCAGLNDVVDCLIGQLGETLPAYDICDIKEYLQKLTDNLYATQKAMLCSDCGQWDILDQLVGDYKELEADQYECIWNQDLVGPDIELTADDISKHIKNSNLKIEVLESNFKLHFRLSGELFARDLSKLHQDHDFHMARDKYTNSWLMKIRFKDTYEWINDYRDSIKDFRNNGFGIFNTRDTSETGKQTRSSWQANYDMMNDHDDENGVAYPATILWRSYNDGYNNQIIDDYKSFFNEGMQIRLVPGIFNYEFTIPKPEGI